VVNWLTVKALSLGLLLIQVPATAILLSRLLKGPPPSPIESQTPVRDFWVGRVVVPTLNEAQRISLVWLA